MGNPRWPNSLGRGETEAADRGGSRLGNYLVISNEICGRIDGFGGASGHPPVLWKIGTPDVFLIDCRLMVSSVFFSGLSFLLSLLFLVIPV